MAIIEFKNVCKDYESNGEKEKKLKKINFKIENENLVMIKGTKNNGATTILNILGGIEKINSGNVLIDGKSIKSLSKKDLINYKRKDVAFIFEKDNLIKNLTVIENIEICLYNKKNNEELEKILKKVNLFKKKDNYPLSLSKTEELKVAIARSLLKKPKLILCDKLDEILNFKSIKQILSLLKLISKEEKITIIIVTSNDDVLPIANKVITINDGVIDDIKINNKPKSVGDLKC